MEYAAEVPKLELLWESPCTSTIASVSRLYSPIRSERRRPSFCILGKRKGDYYVCDRS